MGSDLVASILRAVLLGLVTLGIAGVTTLMIRRPRLHRRRPERRLLPRWLTVLAIMFIGLGAALAVPGTMLLQDLSATAEDRSDGLGIAITGTAMVGFGLFLQWMRMIVHLDSTPEGFVHRDVLGRTVSIRYEDLTHLDTTMQRGAARVRVTDRHGRSFSAALAMFDWTHFERWKVRTGHR